MAGMSTSPGRGGLLAAIRSRFTALQPAATVQLRQVSWDDPTAGLADGVVDVAFVWLPLPDPVRYQWTVVAHEQRLIALPDTHPLASRAVIEFADLLDEPFLALPRSAGPLRDYWLATDARDGRPPRIGAEIASTDETYEALVDGRGVCLLAAGNAPLITLGGVITRPVDGISPSQLALAWQAGDTRPLVADYIRAWRSGHRPAEPGRASGKARSAAATASDSAGKLSRPGLRRRAAQPLRRGRRRPARRAPPAPGGVTVDFRWDQQRRVVAGQVAHSAHVGRHDRPPGPQRLLQDQRLPFPPARQHEHVRRGEQRRHDAPRPEKPDVDPERPAPGLFSSPAWRPGPRR